MSFSTCDLCDAHEEQLANGSLRVLLPGFHSFGKVSSFAGPARTLKVFEDNALVRSTLETPGDKHVLVVDGGGGRAAGNAGLRGAVGSHVPGAAETKAAGPPSSTNKPPAAEAVDRRTASR